MFFGSTMVMVTIALVMTVIVTNIYSKKDSNTHAAAWIIKLASYFYPMYIPERPDITTYHHQTEYHLHEKRHCFNDSRPTPDRHHHGRLPTSQPTLPACDVMSSISDGELDSLAGCTNCCGRHSICEKSAEFGRPHVDADLIEIEWRIIARFADRCFFWLFLVISTCMFTLLFLKMIPPERIHSVSNSVT